MANMNNKRLEAKEYLLDILVSRMLEVIEIQTNNENAHFKFTMKTYKSVYRKVNELSDSLSCDEMRLLHRLMMSIHS